MYRPFVGPYVIRTNSNPSGPTTTPPTAVTFFGGRSASINLASPHARHPAGGAAAAPVTARRGSTAVRPSVTRTQTILTVLARTRRSPSYQRRYGTTVAPTA